MGQNKFMGFEIVNSFWEVNYRRIWVFWVPFKVLDTWGYFNSINFKQQFKVIWLFVFLFLIQYKVSFFPIKVFDIKVPWFVVFHKGKSFNHKFMIMSVYWWWAIKVNVY